jgi:hypothetical protein
MSRDGSWPCFAASTGLSRCEMKGARVAPGLSGRMGLRNLKILRANSVQELGDTAQPEERKGDVDRFNDS